MRFVCEKCLTGRQLYSDKCQCGWVTYVGDAGLETSPTGKPDLTIRELQTSLPWTIRYSSDFRASPMAHKDFAHGLTHVLKSAGALAALVDDMDHRKETADDPEIREHTKYLADLVICAIRMANTFPGGVVDLQRAVEDRLESKNGVTLPRRPS